MAIWIIVVLLLFLVVAVVIGVLSLGRIEDEIKELGRKIESEVRR